MDLHETRFIPQLRRYARALAGPGNPSEELVRETLERAARMPRDYGADRESRMALYTLMHEVYAGRGEVGAGNYEFERAAATLPPEQREVFLLVSVEEMSYEAAAAALGIPIGTVMSRLARAREKLRMLLRRAETRQRPAASNGANGQDP